MVDSRASWEKADRMSAASVIPNEIASLTLPTPFGEWQTWAFDWDGAVHLCLCRGEIQDGEDILVRLHSECLTGDALGSLRCDCGVQLRRALRQIAAEGRGVLVYSTGHEGRGIGLANKLRAYKARAVADAGIRVLRVVGLATTAHARNLRYLTTKQALMGHTVPMGTPLVDDVGPPVDVGTLLGAVRPSEAKPYVVVKYAQTLDGRIATSSGDSRWISGEEERRVSHALRASCDAVLVGVGTVLTDDPQLTVRMVPGASPIRVVLDSTLRIPDRSRLLVDDAATTIVTTDSSPVERRDEIRGKGVFLDELAEFSRPALEALRRSGIRSLLVEGGARVITSFLSLGLADRLIVGIAPRVLGSGTDAVSDLGVREVSNSLRIERRAVHLAGDDVLIAGDIAVT